MTASKPIRVLIVDDHEIVRSGLSIFLEAYEDLEPVGEAADGEEALRLCRELQPDVVLMDLVMPNVDGVSATRAICADYPQTRVIALTSFREQHMVDAALEAGAVAYLIKNVSADQLLETIRAAHAGRLPPAPRVQERRIDAGSAAPVAPGSDLAPGER